MKLPLLDYDGLFHSDSEARCIPFGIQTFTSPKQAESFMEEIYLEDTEEINFDAYCSCRHLKGNYFIGMECPICKQTVRDAFSSEIKFKAWLKLPDYIPPMLHPAAYWVFRKWLGGSKKVFLLDCLLDITAKDKLPEELVEAVGCGYKNFYDNFDKIINYLLNEYPPLQTSQGKDRSAGIEEYVATYRKVMFINHVPVLNSNLHLMTSSGTMRYIDKSSPFVIKTIVELSNLEFKQATGARPELYIDQQTYSIYQAYYEYVFSIVDSKLTKKLGYIRRHMVGSRIHFTSRAVILPIVSEHNADEIYLPWRIGVTMYGLEIHNLLVNRNGHNEEDALVKRNNALFKFDQEISDILKTLIEETPFVGLCVTIGRNPTLSSLH